MEKRDKVAKPIILRDLLTGEMKYIVYEEIYGLKSITVPNMVAKEVIKKNTLLPDDNGTYTRCMSYPKLETVTFTELQNANLLPLLDKVILIEAKFEDSAYWLIKLLTTIEINDAVDMAYTFKDSVNKHMLGVHTINKSIAFKIRNQSKYVSVIINGLPNQDLDKIELKCIGYEDGIIKTDDIESDTVYQINLLQTEFSSFCRISGYDSKVNFHLDIGYDHIKSFTICKSYITSSKIALYKAAGVVIETALSKVTFDNISVVIGRGSIVDTKFNTMHAAYMYLFCYPKCYTPPKIGYVESDFDVINSEINFAVPNDEDEDEEGEWVDYKGSLHINCGKVKIAHVKNLCIELIGPTINTSDNNNYITYSCRTDKYINVNGLNLNTVLHTIGCIDNSCRDPEFLKYRSVYHDDIFTLPIHLLMKQYDGITIKETAIPVYNLIVVNRYNNCSMISYLEGGVPLEKLLKTSGKLTPADRYNNTVIREYLKFIMNRLKM